MSRPELPAQLRDVFLRRGLIKPPPCPPLADLDRAIRNRGGSVTITARASGLCHAKVLMNGTVHEAISDTYPELAVAYALAIAWDVEQPELPGMDTDDELDASPDDYFPSDQEIVDLLRDEGIASIGYDEERQRITDGDGNTIHGDQLRWLKIEALKIIRRRDKDAAQPELDVESAVNDAVSGTDEAQEIDEGNEPGEHLSPVTDDESATSDVPDDEPVDWEAALQSIREKDAAIFDGDGTETYELKVDADDAIVQALSDDLLRAAAAYVTDDDKVDEMPQPPLGKRNRNKLHKIVVEALKSETESGTDSGVRDYVLSLLAGQSSPNVTLDVPEPESDES